MSQKAAEVDALNDQLTEERKKSRDLQWAIEKERCHIGRNEENQREELEVRAFRWVPPGVTHTLVYHDSPEVQ